MPTFVCEDKKKNASKLVPNLSDRDRSYLVSDAPQSYLLARQAKREKRLTGEIQVICPKCHEKPVITTSMKGERTYVECKCGYIYSEDINF